MDSDEKGIRAWCKKNQFVITPVLSIVAIFVSGILAFFGAKEGTKVVMNNVLKSNASANATQTTYISSATPDGVSATKTKDVLGIQDSIFNLDDWTLEKGILKKDGLFCNIGRKGFEVGHIVLKDGLKVGEKVTMRVKLSKNDELKEEVQDPKLVLMYDENYRMLIPGKDIGFIEFDNFGSTENVKLKGDQIDVSKDIVIEYSINHITSNKVYFKFLVTFTPIGGGQQSVVPGEFYANFDADPVSLPTKKFGLGMYEGTCLSIESFIKTPVGDADIVLKK